jgi:hypothetical protein
MAKPGGTLMRRDASSGGGSGSAGNPVAVTVGPDDGARVAVGVTTGAVGVDVAWHPEIKNAISKLTASMRMNFIINLNGGWSKP